MKKILIMTGSMNVGGIEKALVEMLKIMPYDLYEVDLLLEEPEGVYMSEIPKEVNMVYNPTIANCLYKSRKKQIKEMLEQKQITKILKLLFESIIYAITKNRCRYFSWQCSRMDRIEKKYDVAIAYSNPFRFPGHYILKNVIADKKILWNHTDLLYDKINHSGFKRLYENVDCFVNVSYAALESCAKIFPEMRNKMTVYYNVINSDEIIKKSKEFDVDEKNDAPKLLTVGRLSSEKGQDRIPDIARILKKRNVDFIWYIVGSGPLFNQIKIKIEKYGLRKCVILVGNKDNPYPYIRMCDIYVQTSWQEAYCLTIHEARVLKKPIVTTNLKCMQEQIISGENGLIVENNIDEIANGIYILINNPSLRLKFSKEIKIKKYDNVEEIKKIL